MSNRSWQARWGFLALKGRSERMTAVRSLVSQLLGASLILLIDAYRRLVSPLLGPHCRFHPTCSQYALEAIRLYGPLSGSARAIARLARCHPLGNWGHDPVR